VLSNILLASKLLPTQWPAFGCKQSLKIDCGWG
jgi:hypothetical protein